MDVDNVMKKLARASANDLPPTIDVSRRVLKTITAAEEPGNAVLWVFTAASSVAAAVVVIAAIHFYSAHETPFADFINSMMMVMQ